MTSQSAFVTTVDPQEVGVRNFKKLETSRGAYLNVTYSGKKFVSGAWDQGEALDDAVGSEEFC